MFASARIMFQVLDTVGIAVVGVRNMWMIKTIHVLRIDDLRERKEPMKTLPVSGDLFFERNFYFIPFHV